MSLLETAAQFAEEPQGKFRVTPVSELRTQIKEAVHFFSRHCARRR
jgi:hypothetical protein